MQFGELAGFYERLEGISSRLAMIDVLTELFKAASADEIAHVIYITQGVLAPPFEGIEFGMAEKMVEEAIALSTGREKEAVEREYRKTGDMGIAACNLKATTKLKRISERKYSINEVYEMMRKIASTSGEGSKETKIKLLANMIAAAEPVEAKYIVKYPLDELRMGVGDATMLEALSVMAAGHRKLKGALERAYNLCSDMGMVADALKRGGEAGVENFRITLFKPIRPALAERLPTAEAILEKMGGECSVEQKYDGFRCQVHKKGRRVEVYSRRLERTTEMYPDLVKAAVEEIDADSAIIDGEALAYNESTGQFLPFQETIQRKRKHGVEAKALELPLRLFAFDLMYLDGKSYMDRPYGERRSEIERLFRSTATIVPSNRILATKPKQLEGYFESAIENGLEGIVAKDLNAPYVAGARKFSWIKMKRSYKGEMEDTVDLVIIGYYRGRGQRTEFKFGGLLCATYNEKTDKFETLSRIGTGFSEAQMMELHEKLKKIEAPNRPARVDALVEPDFWVYPKYVVTVRADEITKSPMHTCGREAQADGTEVGYALRFPRLEGEEAIRKDKGPEEATTTKEIVEMFHQQKHVSMLGGDA